MANGWTPGGTSCEGIWNFSVIQRYGEPGELCIDSRCVARCMIYKRMFCSNYVVVECFLKIPIRKSIHGYLVAREMKEVPFSLTVIKEF